MLPGEIKNRILLTVDFDEDLIGVARSAGRLNIENALSLGDDILVVKAKTKDDSGMDVEKVATLYGELAPVPDQDWICKNTNLNDRPLAPHTVGRVVHLFRPGANTAQVWEQSTGVLIQSDCNYFEGVVKFREKGAKSEPDYMSYEWSNVISIIPKLH